MKTWMIVIVIAVVLIAVIFFVTKSNKEIEDVKDYSGAGNNDATPQSDLQAFLNLGGSIFDYMSSQNESSSNEGSTGVGDGTGERKIIKDGLVSVLSIPKRALYSAFGISYECSGRISRNGICSGVWTPQRIIKVGHECYKCEFGSDDNTDTGCMSNALVEVSCPSSMSTL